MGNSRWSDSDWNQHVAAASTQTRAQIFTNTNIDADLDPTKFAFRESRDSASNPESTPVIIGADETGSMGVLAEAIIRKDLGVVMKEIYDRKPVSDPHICCLALGDAACDSAPIQATQFEADIKLADQLSKFYLEGNGGGNGGESYPLAWYFAAHKVKADAIIKKRHKGYLFTIGDESPLPSLTKDQIRRFLDPSYEGKDVKLKDLLAEVSKDWEVYHLIVETVSTEYQDAINKWRDLLGERAVVVRDHSALAEVIVSIMQVNEGTDPQEVVDSWTGDTKVLVSSAVAGLLPAGR